MIWYGGDVAKDEMRHVETRSHFCSRTADVYCKIISKIASMNI